MSDIDAGLIAASSNDVKKPTLSDTPAGGAATAEAAEEQTSELPTLAPTAAQPDADGRANKDDTNGTKPGSDPDRDDSEAETVLSSPVKRREALRKTNGATSELGTIVVAQDVSKQDNLASANAVRSSAEAPNGCNGDKQDGPSSSHHRAPENERSLEDDQDDVRSHRSSQKARSVASHDFRTTSRSPGAHGEKRRHMANGHNGYDEHYSRKRKHRESSAGQRQTNPESAKRPRRASLAGRKSSDRSSEEPDPPPRLRRHKRSSSGNTKDEAGDDDTTQAGRSRRAASHLTLQNQRAFKTTWDSGSESEVSAKHAQGRSTRGIGNRSFSTPGRPTGRDHKRHVNKYGFTRLAEACEAGDLDLVKEWRAKDPEQLEQREFAGNTPLQVASLNGNVEIVQYLLAEGCNPHCANSDKDTPLIDAVENGHPEVVKLLLEAGVDPLKQNMKGQQALDLINEESESATDIRKMLRAAIEQWKAKGAQRQHDLEEQAEARPGPKQALHFMARTPDNLMKLVLDNDRNGVTEFLNARVPVDNGIVAAAAKTGDVYLVNMLLAEMSPRKAKSRPDKPMMAVIGTSHFEMVKTLTDLDQFDPLHRDKKSGLLWHEIAEARNGPHVDKELQLLTFKYKEAKMRRGSSPSPVPGRGENGSRRYVSADVSDAEMEEADSPDAGKTKRRLMSKKDMRAVGSRKSPSSASSRAASSPEAVAKPNESDDVKQPQRKGRTQSMSSSQAGDGKVKRVVAGRREEIAMFNPGNPSKKRKSDSGKGLDKASEALSNNVKNLSVIKQAEEKAEALRKEAEEAARKAEEERVVREAREAQERQAAQERQEQREAKLQTYPSAVRRVLEMDGSNLSSLVELLCKRFLPLQAVSGYHLDLKGEDPESLWILSYQAALVLRGTAADDLLSLPTAPEDISPLRDIQRYPVSTEQRQAMIPVLESNNFCGDSPDKIGPDTGDLQAAIDDWKASRPRVHAECDKFLTMEPLGWINARDFLAAKAELQKSSPEKYAHLQRLPQLELWVDALHEAPFSRPPARGTPPISTPSNVLDGELRQKYGSWLKESDGRVRGVLMTAWHKTEVEVVYN